MKIKRAYSIFCALIFCLCIAICTELPVLSAGRVFVASKYSDVFHKSNCHYVENIIESNKIYFDSIGDAKASGRRGCSHCAPTRFYPYDTGYEDGYNNGYDNGYNDGFDEGFNDGENHGFDEGYDYGYEEGFYEAEIKLEDDVSSAEHKANLYATMLLIGLPVAFIIGIKYTERSTKTDAGDKSEPMASCEKALFAEKVRHFIHKVTTVASLPITRTICATVTFWVVVSIGLIATISLFNLNFYVPDNESSILYCLYLLRVITQPACCLIAYLLARAINEKERTACIFASNAICSIGFLLLAFMSGTITQKLVLIASGIASIITLIFEYLRIKKETQEH